MPRGHAIVLTCPSCRRKEPEKRPGEPGGFTWCGYEKTYTKANRRTGVGRRHRAFLHCEWCGHEWWCANQLAALRCPPRDGHECKVCGDSGAAQAYA